MPLTAEQRDICKQRIEPWRSAMTQKPISGDPIVVFSIPVISRDKARDWAQVCANLGHTVETLRRQNNPDWKAVICCQSEPDGISFDDQVLFLPFTDRVEGNDNGLKRRAITEFCRETQSGDVYLFKLDADDFVHSKLVDYMVTTRDPSGYLIDRGYMYNAASGAIAPLHRADKDAVRRQEGPLGLAQVPRRLDNVVRKLTGRGFANFPPRLSKMRSFDSSCGSCVAWRYRFDDETRTAPGTPDLDHRLIRPANEEGLMHLNPVPFHAVIYVIGHGENIQEAKGRLHHKTRYIDAFELSQKETRQVLSDFGIG